MNKTKTTQKRRIVIFSIIAMMLSCSIILTPDSSYAASNLKIGGVDIGYAAGQYFSENGKACTCHNKGICISKPSKCNCVLVNKTAQCYAFALWCENKMFGYNDKSHPSKFKNVGSVAAGKLTASKIKQMISAAPVGAHIRTKGSQHSMILMAKTSKGFTIAQANGQNNKEYSGHKACRIGTYTYTWNSYAKSTYGKRGITFIKYPKNYKLKTVAVTTTPTVKASKGSFTVGQSAKVSWSSVANASGYWLDVYYGSNKIASKAVKGGSSHTISPVKQGTYTVYISAYNSSSKKIGKCTFRVNYPAGSQTVSDGEYYITSALDSTKCLNVKSYSKSDGGNIQLWASGSDIRQTFYVTYLGGGYYKIIAKNSGKSLDVKAHGMTSGTNVQQWKYAGTANQQWIIKQADDWNFYIVSKHSGLYLDAQGGKSANGTNVQVHAGNGTAAQKWKFVACGSGTGQTVSNGTYHIVSALDNSKSLNVKNCSKSDGVNVHLWTKNTNQRYTVTYIGNGFYKLINTNSGKSLDVARGSTRCGANVQQWSYTGVPQQQWILKSAGNGYYYIIARNSGLYLDAQGGKSVNGTNIQAYIGNGTASQKWKLVK